ncbi:MAG: chromate efflux transporter [Coleofasciculaceae cyanobacterium RL_1_1]|nr:chromate efflux transporter [Coleofasciculaceae cyanobacterium RL_1_1]
MTQRLIELARLFLRLGIVGFGGPQAHIGMQNDEAVVRRGWLTPEEFAQGLAVCELLPGPASTQMGIYIGYVRAGVIGAIVAGLSFIAPAFLIVVGLSWGYFRWQGVPQLEALFLGIFPVVVAIVAAFCWKLSRKAIQRPVYGAIAIGALGLAALGSIDVPWIFLMAGAIGVLLAAISNRSRSSSGAWLLPVAGVQTLPPFITMTTGLPEVLTVASFWGGDRIADFALPLAGFFLKAGSAIFGGGLTIIPLLEFEVVERFHWLTIDEFISGVAIGQLSPGPVVLTAAFVGYKVAGFFGALVSTVAIFTPSFGFIILAAPLLRRLTQNDRVKAFLQGVTPAVLGTIAASMLPLARSAFVQPSIATSIFTVAIGVAALVAILRYKTPTWMLVPGGAAVGLLWNAIA